MWNKNSRKKRNEFQPFPARAEFFCFRVPNILTTIYPRESTTASRFVLDTGIKEEHEKKAEKKKKNAETNLVTDYFVKHLQLMPASILCDQQIRTCNLRNRNLFSPRFFFSLSTHSNFHPSLYLIKCGSKWGDIYPANNECVPRSSRYYLFIRIAFVTDRRHASGWTSNLIESQLHWILYTLQHWRAYEQTSGPWLHEMR